MAIIMDGNGRWAKARGLPRTAGHKRGADAVNAEVAAKDGAIFVRNADDLLAELPEEERRRLKRRVAAREDVAMPAHLSPDAAALHAALDADEPKDADALLSATGLDAARFSAALVHLELEGLVTVLPGALFVKPRARS